MKLTVICKFAALLTLWVDPVRTFNVPPSRSMPTGRKPIDRGEQKDKYFGDNGRFQSCLVSSMSYSNSDTSPDTQTSTVDDNDLPGQSKKGVYQIKTEEQYR
jgi:hypothetical protein